MPFQLQPLFSSLLLSCLLLASGTQLSLAQETEPISPDRPDQTNSPNIVAPGTIQLETGWLYSFEASSENNLTTSSSHAFPQFMFRIGLLEPLELRIDYAGYNWSSQSLSAAGQPPETRFSQGTGDPGLGIKYKFLDGASWWLPSAGIEARSGFVMGPASQLVQAVDPSLVLLLENTFNEYLSLGYNLGLSSESEKNEAGLLSKDSQGQPVRNHSFHYSFSLGISLLENLEGFLEVYGRFPLTGAVSSHALDGGVFLALSDDLKLDLAAGIGLNSGGSWFIGLGGSYRWAQSPTRL